VLTEHKLPGCRVELESHQNTVNTPTVMMIHCDDASFEFFPLSVIECVLHGY